MANNSIQTRFTEANYATKQEVIHELKTPLIDSFWKMIVTYRNGFAEQLGVYEIDRTPITYCLCPSIANKIDESKAKLHTLLAKYNAMSDEGNDLNIYANDSMIAILKEVAKKNDLQVDDNFLRMVINNRITNDDDSLKALNKYVQASNIIKNNIEQNINEDLLADLYSALTSGEEMVSLYRTSDYLSDKNNAVIDRLYRSAPANLIPNLMNDYLRVVNANDLPIVVKTALAYYFISYIKPFAKANEEIAALLAKLVLAKSDIGEVALSLNIEKLISDNTDRFNKICMEVQKNNDFTYFLDMFMKILNDACEKEILRLNNLEALSLKKEYYKEDLQEAAQSPVYEEPTVEAKPEAVQPTVEEVTTPQNVVPTPAYVAPQPVERTVVGLAISTLPPILDEKEAQRLEEHLLETDPELRHSQAYFYARHCTMGKRYTISQFKKEVGCAYETARTSMDALASLGYYRQEMVKNKKVYTPIKRN